MSIKKTIKKVMKKVLPPPIRRRLKRLMALRSIPAVLSNLGDLHVMQDVDKLYANQFNDAGTLNRFDVIVRYMAIREIFRGGQEAMHLYHKMQRRRGSGGGSDTPYEERMRALVASINAKGFDPNSCVKVGRQQQLLDGSHRLAAAIYFGHRVLPVEFSERNRWPRPYGLSWFAQNGFTPDEIEAIRNAKNDVDRRLGRYFHLIIWPPATDLVAEIDERARQELDVIQCYTLELGESLAEFTHAVYESDDIAAWKVDRKLEGFRGYPPVAHVIEFELARPKFRRKSLNNHAISTQVERIKREYRERYKQYVPGYFHDIVCHIGDNFEHTRAIAQVLEQHGAPHREVQ